MAYVETWSFGLNTTPTDQTTQTLQAASFLMQLKAFLVAGGWSVVQSCDSTQYATNGTDYWAALSNLVWASSGVHSWIVLKSPEGIVAGANGSYVGDQSRLWFSIDLLVTSGLVYTATFRFHRVNPGGTTSTSVCPTSTDQIGVANQQFLKSTLTATCRWHFMCTAKGAFLAFTNYASSGYTPFALCLFPVTGVKKNAAGTLDYPYAIVNYMKWNDANYGALWNAKTFSVSNNLLTAHIGPWGHHYTATGMTKGWSFDGTAADIRLGQVTFCEHESQYFINGGSFYYSVVPMQVGDWITAAGDAWSGAKRCDGDVAVIAASAGKAASIGILSDITNAGGGYSQGSVNDDASIQYSYVGSYWLPSNTTILL